MRLESWWPWGMSTSLLAFITHRGFSLPTRCPLTRTAVTCWWFIWSVCDLCYALRTKGGEATELGRRQQCTWLKLQSAVLNLVHGGQRCARHTGIMRQVLKEQYTFLCTTGKLCISTLHNQEICFCIFRWGYNIRGKPFCFQLGGGRWQK